MTTAKPRVWTVFVAFLAAFGAISLGGGVVLGVALASALRQSGRFEELGSDPNAMQTLITSVSVEPWFVLASAAISALALAIAAIGAAKLSPIALVERLRLGPAHGGTRRFAVAPLAAVAALGAGGAVVGALELIVGKQSDALIGLRQAASSTGLMLVLTFVVIAVMAPVGEEVFFRGYAQTRFVARFGRFAGILGATGLFAFLHLDPMHVAVAFAIGLVLAWTTERTGSIRPAIFAHAANNLLFVVSAQMSQSTPPTTTWKVVVGLSLTTAFALAGVALLTSSPRAAPT